MVFTLNGNYKGPYRVGSYISVLMYLPLMHHLANRLIHQPWDYKDAYRVGSYINPEIIEMPMGLALAWMYHHCTTYPIGSYTGPKIIEMSIGLALTVMYH